MDRAARGFLVVLVVLFSSSCRTLHWGPAATAESLARAYFDAWSAGRFAEMSGWVTPLPATFEAQHQRFRDDLKIVSSRFAVLGVERADPEKSFVRFRATHVLRGLGEWDVDSQLALEQVDGHWKVRWSPAVLHPEAKEGARFSRTRAQAKRGELLDARDQPLTHECEVFAIGVEPGRVQDPAAVSSALREQLSLDPARIDQLLASASATPQRFVPIVEVRAERYQRVRPALAPVPGIFFRKRLARLTPAEGFAAHALGRAGEITAELLAQWGPLYQAGDTVGLSGLEKAFEPQLAGLPSGEVKLTQSSGESRVLVRFEGRPGTSVRTTLNPELQALAEAALEGVTRPAALVAVDSGTGAILATASRPLNEPLHRAFTGRYPPGSTFKVVTSEALLARGVRVDAPSPCPTTATVQGKSFRNFEGESLGNTTLRTAFAHSCNTAFVTWSQTLRSDELIAAAKRFGFGVDYRVGIPTAGASFPEPVDAAERASAAIGQGRVLATPLHMATVAAAAETGVWRSPYLVDGVERGPTESLSPGASASLQTLMRAVVLEGSGRSAAQVPALAGKTGTAEFGPAAPFQTHAWFIGFRKGVAFAVLVDAGGVGGRVAVPIAAKFAAGL